MAIGDRWNWATEVMRLGVVIHRKSYGKHSMRIDRIRVSVHPPGMEGPPKVPHQPWWVVVVVVVVELEGVD